jgi:extradiol dioxygenase family protein
MKNVVKFDIDHAAFIVDDIDKAILWYEDRVQATVKYRDKDWAMLDVYGNSLALTLPGKHPNHIALKVNNIEDLPNNVFNSGEIKQHRDGSSYIYLVDPYGNAIEWIYYS